MSDVQEIGSALKALTGDLIMFGTVGTHDHHYNMYVYFKICMLSAFKFIFGNAVYKRGLPILNDALLQSLLLLLGFI